VFANSKKNVRVSLLDVLEFPPFLTETVAINLRLIFRQKLLREEKVAKVAGVK